MSTTSPTARRSPSATGSDSSCIATICPISSGPSGLSFEALLGARPCPPPEGFLAEGEEIDVAGLRLRVLHTPGHTPGGVCLIDDASHTILVGDTLFAGSVGRTDLPGGDWETLRRSIQEKLFRLPGDWRLLPGHGPETTLEAERRDNPFVGLHAHFVP